MASQQYPSPSPDDRDAALDSFMDSLPAPGLFPEDTLRQSFKAMSEDSGAAIEFNPFRDSETEALKDRVRGDFDWALRSDDRYGSTSLSAIMFPTGYHVIGEEGELTALFVEARDEKGNSAIHHSGCLEIYSDGPVALVVFLNEKTKFVSQELLFSKAAHEEGIANLKSIDLDDYPEPDDYPYHLWLAAEELKDVMNLSDLSVSDVHSIANIDEKQSSFMFRTVFGDFLVTFDLHPQHSTVTAYCREFQGLADE